MSILNKKVDKIFVINLKERKDKYERIKLHMKQQKITNYERFNAIKPNLTDIYENKNLLALYRKSCFGIGVIGCKLSHLAVINLAKKRGYKSILILEDDAFPLSNFSENIKKNFHELEETKTDWDMLYLGANHKSKGVTISPHIKRCFSAYTTSSYIVKSVLYDTILENANLSPVEIDNYYVNEIQKKYKVYSVSPNLITQYDSVSDISGNFTSYDFGEC